MNARAAALVLLTACAGCATAPLQGDERRIVEAEGWAPEVPGDAAGTRARALADAQKRAVEKVSGVRVASATRVDAAIAVRQRIWTDSTGRIESWTVLAEKTEGGLHKTAIRAVVRRAPEGESGGAPPPSDAKIRVAGAGPAEAGLRRGFGARGFALVERGADFVVTARTSSESSKDARLAPFVTGRARVSVTVVDAASGAVVWEQSREAAGLDNDPLLASAQAGENAGALAGEAAAEGLAEYLWKR